jgi:uncharacterized membrane protein
MKPLFVLSGSFLIALIFFYFLKNEFDFNTAGQIAMALMMAFSAISHFVFTKGMIAMIPDFLPMKKQIVYVTGVIEVLLGMGLLFSASRLLAGWMLVAFFILLLPANINASMKNINYHTGERDGNGIRYLWFRIPLQLFYILWVVIFVIVK